MEHKRQICVHWRVCSINKQFSNSFWSTIEVDPIQKEKPIQNVSSFPVAQMVEHGASNAKIMGSIPRESKSWSNVKNCNLNAM